MRWPGAAGAADSPRDGRSRGLRRIRATVLLIAPMLAGCAAEPVADADVVRCLAPQNRARMVDAAVALNLAQRTADPTQVVVGSRPLSLEQWRDEPDSEFDRACTAYGAASGAGAGGDGGGSGGPWLTSVVTLLAALVGAVGAGMVTAHLNHRGRRYQYATDLRRAASAFERVGAGYLRGRRQEAKPLAGQAVLDGRDELDETVRQIVDRHPSWLGLSRLRARLRESPLDEGLDQWLLPKSDRPQRLRELEERLAEVVGDAMRLARAMESRCGAGSRCMASHGRSRCVRRTPSNYYRPGAPTDELVRTSRARCRGDRDGEPVRGARDASGVDRSALPVARPGAEEVVRGRRQHGAGLHGVPRAVHGAGRQSAPGHAGTSGGGHRGERLRQDVAAAPVCRPRRRVDQPGGCGGVRGRGLHHRPHPVRVRAG